MGSLSPVHWLVLPLVALAFALNIGLPAYGILNAVKRREARLASSGWLIGAVAWSVYILMLALASTIHLRQLHYMTVPLVATGIAWVWLCVDANRRATRAS